MAETVVDTLIVGAGLSGLQAALDLHAAGKHVVLIEARDRVGGKTNSCERPDGKGIQELGAAWVNDTNQSHVWEYCKRFQLTPVVQNIEGSVACEDTEGRCHTFPFGELPRVGWTLRVLNNAMLIPFSLARRTWRILLGFVTKLRPRLWMQRTSYSPKEPRSTGSHSNNGVENKSTALRRFGRPQCGAGALWDKIHPMFLHWLFWR
jgi:phytoene dehydrogenase-like protein